MVAARFRPNSSFLKYFRVEETSITFPARNFPPVLSLGGVITLEKAQVYVILYYIKKEPRDKRTIHGHVTSPKFNRCKECRAYKIPSADVDHTRASRKTYSLYFTYRGASARTCMPVSRINGFVESIH